MSDERLHGLLASGRQAVLATINADGTPQLSNVFYVWDADAEIARISTLAGRVKARNLELDGRCSMHVGGDHFWQYVVATGFADLSPVATEPGDEACLELLAVHSFITSSPDDEEKFFDDLIEQGRRVIRLRPKRLHGVWLDEKPY